MKAPLQASRQARRNWLPLLFAALIAVASLSLLALCRGPSASSTPQKRLLGSSFVETTTSRLVSNGASATIPSTKNEATRPAATNKAVKDEALVQNLFKRAPRIPPGDLALKRCLAALHDEEDEEPNPSSSSSVLDDTHSATNLLFSESRKDVLLGECNCPLKTAPPYEGWAFKCEEWDHKILTELAPWHSVNITPAAIEWAANFNKKAKFRTGPPYRFSFVGGKGWWGINDGAFDTAYHDVLLSMMQGITETVALPDVDMIYSTFDMQNVGKTEAMPWFSSAKDRGKNDIVAVNPSLWSHEKQDFDIAPKGDCKDKPWEDRDPRVLTRLTCTGPWLAGYQPEVYPAYLRVRLTELTAQYPELLDAGLVFNCAPVDEEVQTVQKRAQKPFPSPLAQLDMNKEACNYQYLILLDGNTYSGRSMRYLGSGSVMFKPDSVFSEWYYHLLKPFIHYVPVHEYLEDLPEMAAFMRENQELGRCIADNAKKFVKRVLNKHSASCYMWRLLTAWARQASNHGKKPEGMLELDDWYGTKHTGGLMHPAASVHPLIKSEYENRHVLSHDNPAAQKKFFAERKDALQLADEKAQEALDNLDREAQEEEKEAEGSK